MRNDFRGIGPKPQAFEGQIGTAMLTKEEADSFKPYTIPLNNVAVQLDAGLDEDVRLARSVAEQFASLSFPCDEELAKMRKAPDTA